MGLLSGLTGLITPAESLSRETSGWDGGLDAQSNWTISSSSSVSEYDTNCIAYTLCSEIIKKLHCHALNNNVLTLNLNTCWRRGLNVKWKIHMTS